MFASGDVGVNSGSPTPVYTCNTFTPSFPASSPWVTSVGATLLSKNYLPVCNFTGNHVCDEVGEVVSRYENE